jgi:hypothetical protein
MNTMKLIWTRTSSNFNFFLIFSKIALSVYGEYAEREKVSKFSMYLLPIEHEKIFRSTVLTMRWKGFRRSVSSLHTWSKERRHVEWEV